MRFWKSIFVVALTLAAVVPAAAKDKQMIEKFKCTSMDSNNRPAMVEIGISQWSTEQERQELLAVLQQGGGKALGDQLQKIKKSSSKGFMSLPRTMGMDLGYAYQFDQGDTRIIIVATDRPPTAGESMSGSLTDDNNVTFANLVLDKSGSGKGQLYIGARMYLDESGKLAVKDAISASELTKIQSVSTK